MCKETKDTVEFNKDKHRNDGLQRWCKSCQKENYVKLRDYRKTNPPPTPATKKCRTCKETKDTGEFSKRKASKDGLRYTCRGCAAAYYVLFQRKNTRRNTLAGPPDRTGTKKCPDCGETKHKTEFSNDACSLDGLQGKCKPCNNVRSSQWAKDNPAKHCAKTARRKARKLKATPSWEDKRKTLWYYDESQRITAETGELYITLTILYL
jgi:hypothetical protein